MGIRKSKENVAPVSKTPVSNEIIYKITLTVTILVAAVFFLKNLITKDVMGAVVVGVVLLVFSVAVFLMKKFKVKDDIKYLVVGIGLIVVITLISLMTGTSYSDDFLLYLAAIALTGMYFRPNYPKIQIGLSNIVLVILYLANPTKGGPLGQYIMCIAVFNVAAIMFLMVIKRGRTFIDISEERTKEVEDVIESVTVINNELTQNFARTQKRIEDVAVTNEMVETRTADMQEDTKIILESVSDAVDTCTGAQATIVSAKGQMSNLNKNIRHFEDVLRTNEDNINNIAGELRDVKISSEATEEVFEIITAQMEKIIDVMSEIKKIANSTTMLALNASIEAARAGEAGKGFAVVAGKVQELAVNSNKCSAEVEEVVGHMQEQVNTTLEQIKSSVDNVDSTIKSLDDLNASFEELTSKFDDIYTDIEAQNASVEAIEEGFDRVAIKVADVNDSVKKNQESSDAIAQSVKVYGENMKLMEEDTGSLKVLVESMQHNLKA